MRWIVLLAVAVAGRALGATYPLPPAGQSVVGELTFETTVEEDTLVDIARRHRLGYEEVVLANPTVDRWLPGQGTPVTLPTRFILPPGPREGIVVNLAEFRLYYYPKPKPKKPAVVETFAVGAGREDWQTPAQIRTTVSRRLKNPAWYPPASIRREHKAEGRHLPAVVPPGPDNPLGPLALKLGIPGGYFIHGTSRPFGIGMKVTHGCLRLYPEDMELLFRMVPEGTPVRVIDQPYKTGWKNGLLYLEAHPAISADGIARVDLAAVEERLRIALRQRPDYEIDWDGLASLTLRPRGIPVPITGPAAVRAAADRPRGSVSFRAQRGICASAGRQIPRSPSMDGSLGMTRG
jgi:L,D-transpeptidase ErfK/SrfK